MAGLVTIARSTVFEGEAWGTAALVTFDDGTALVQANIDVIKAFVQEGDGTSRTARTLYEKLNIEATDLLALPGSPEVISDLLRNDGYWSGEQPGYNFLHYLFQGSDFDAAVPPFKPKGGRTYLLTYEVMVNVAGPKYLQHVITVLDRPGRT